MGGRIVIAVKVCCLAMQLQLQLQINSPMHACRVQGSRVERGSFRGSSSGGMGVSGRMSSSSGGNYCSSGEGPTDQHAKIEQLDPPSCIERGAKRAAHLPQHCIG